MDDERRSNVQDPTPEGGQPVGPSDGSDPRSLGSTKRAGVGAAKRRGHGLLLVLAGLFIATMACVVVLFDAYAEFEVATVEVERRRSAPVPRRVARGARVRAAVPGEIAAAASGPLAAVSWQVGRRVGAGNPRFPSSVAHSSRHPGGRPDAETPQGGKLLGDLAAAAREGPDVEKRMGAVRSLSGMFGPRAGRTLSEIADDPTQPMALRDLAAGLRRAGVEAGR